MVMVQVAYVLIWVGPAGNMKNLSVSPAVNGCLFQAGEKVRDGLHFFHMLREGHKMLLTPTATIRLCETITSFCHF